MHIRDQSNEKADSVPSTEDVDTETKATCGNESNGVQPRDSVKLEEEHLVEIDSMGAETDGAKVLPSDEGRVLSDLDLSSGLGWLLGCRNRIVLTSERPSKKRKLLGTDAGLDKVLIAYPCEGNSTLCDFCCKGEVGNDASRLIVCSSCKVAVHRKCYGVQGNVNESWLCSWCKQRPEGSDSVKHPCVLCPTQGGALKPVSTENGDSGVGFAHLFCSQWMPEVYIGDLISMEPIMNVSNLKETRRKLICSICKMKFGACIRCSHGACRATFHPICAREARQRMEVWGKYGCDNVELRAFCAKHSEVIDGRSFSSIEDPLTSISNDLSVANSVTLSTDKEYRSNISQNRGDATANADILDSNASKANDRELHETGVSDCTSNTVHMSEIGDVEHQNRIGMFENSTELKNLALALRKLIDRGKVNMKDVASELGISPERLVSTLAEDSLVPDLRSKIVKWFENHAFMESDIPDAVAVKSVPPRRRTKSSIKILRGNRVICSSEESLIDNGVEMDESKVDGSLSKEPENNTQSSVPDSIEERLINVDGLSDSSLVNFPAGCSNDPSHDSVYEKIESGPEAVPEQCESVMPDQGNLISADMKPLIPDLMRTGAISGHYVRPSICEELPHMQSELLSENKACDIQGSDVGEISRLEASYDATFCCNHHGKHSKCYDMVSVCGGVDSELQAKAKNLEISEFSPADEVEGEIFYFQHKLLGNAVKRKHLTDNLICRVMKSLPQEIDAARNHRWDDVLVNQYLSELREARKQGRKERKHKEAQAVLAAATAAAAASTRNSSFRKDSFDESIQQEKFNASNGRATTSSQLVPRPREMASRVAVPKISSDKYSDFVQFTSDFSKDQPRSCDICRRSETIMNPILVCSSCKVAVHLDCYRSVKESTGPWYCELCEEFIMAKSSGAPSVDFWEKPCFVVECGLCGGNTGAFRKSTNGQWVHAFCAEWIFEQTFRRGQVNPIEGMETLVRGSDSCCVCRRKDGICIKCSYGHCQTTFHPSCARNTDFYMYVKTLAGKLQHKAYCGKHSVEQRAKVETQRHGVEEIRSIKQIRVELERLRLLCERIIKREKLKRDLVLCSHNVLAFKRDHAAQSLLHSSFLPPDVSSESATTSLKGNTDGYKSCSDAIQRSDDVTVDSTIHVKHRFKGTVSLETDQKTDDSSTSQLQVTQKPSVKPPFAGKQIPQRSFLTSRNSMDDGEWRSKSRKIFEKELVMTSDQASAKNQQLPKGYFYIPVDCLPKEKQSSEDACSGGQLENGT
ncbi:hypothetical protein K2173_023019 [Erythroxylum novogranatense]|uniref:PHD finger family protein n=1 Tax=Erythroxylum novogranatense TaxID=1862640 RepID=A0AAV8T9D9_9ROSI|nr:hypothetical protein K2173_023019 [Erythroxylum novogranatense]